MTNEPEAQGTFACPICGHDKPHHHPDEQVAAYREDQERDDGWTSPVHRQPKEDGWYLCAGVEVDADQFGGPQDGYLAEHRWRQLSWLKWVREAGARQGPGWEHEVQEVLYYSRRGQSGWYLRNWLGNAVPSGEESRFPVRAQPKHWRELPVGVRPTALRSAAGQAEAHP